MSTNTLIDLNKLYKTYFNSSPYYVTKEETQPTIQDVGYFISKQNPYPKGTIQRSKQNQPFNKIGAYGQEIWGAITLRTIGGLSIEIEACTVAVQLSKTIVKTAVSERQGTVKECFHTDDYRFTIKGFLIDKNRSFPEDQINTLKEIFETQEAVDLLGGYPEMFLTDSAKIVIETLDFPEVQGKARWIRPFQMTCESDLIKDLIIK
ncbi:DUF6046 domain-containing protein [Flavobacterium aquicola]|uniref:DUF6046 domain-containing protein n=1 Tax=Flavobacterium aquicola TaxID=1682742 RepID=A0A3E0E421_9FLAO|nr:DUF6046 domain-containing protein [Flavobacterium aquicola]REG92998.1 hypothetical protein C8P67_11499 [Flavobacterium aquicola]